MTLIKKTVVGLVRLPVIAGVALILGQLIIAAPVWAACSGASPNLVAASANLTDVSSCLAAAVDGDTITVPGGSATWTSTQTITKFVKLIASGTVTITDNSAGGDPAAGGSASLFTIMESTAGSTKIQGFTFVQGTAVHLGTAGIIETKDVTNGQPILIAGNTFTQGWTGNAIAAHTNRGVIWSNTFTGAPVGGACLNNASALRHKPSGLSSSWSTPSTFGSADTTGRGNLYFENNTLKNVLEGIDTDDNGRTVVRYNTIINSGITLHGVDTSGIYGARYVEFYNNTWILDSTPNATCGGLQTNVNGWINVRGGTALIHDNVLPDPSNATWGQKGAVIFNVELLRRYGGGFPCWDTVTAPGSGYPTPHNTGWGYVSGATVVNGTNCPNCPVRQDIEPIYIWNNTGTGNYNSPLLMNYDCNAGQTCPNCTSCPLISTYVQQNREYYVGTPKPGYTPYTYPHPLTAGVQAPTGLTVR